MPRPRFPRPAGYHWDAKDPITRPDGLKPCRWCCGPVHPPKRSWCGDKTCIAEWQRRTSGQSGCRALCERRDKGVCAGCGLDTEALRLEWWKAGKASRPATDAATRSRVVWSRGQDDDAALPGGAAMPRTLDRRIAKALVEGEPLWNADHVCEIADGGDPFDPANLQTLCLACHAIKTRDSAGARRKGGVLEIPSRLFPDCPE